MAKWCVTLIVALLMAGLPDLAFAQEKPGKNDKLDQPEQPAVMEQKAVELQVVRDTVAAGISDREPIDAGDVFSPGLDRIYYFTEVQSQSPSTEITHVWYYGDREMARVTLPVEGSRWRTWSSKQILPSWTGKWTVEAVSADGTVVASQAFSVEAGSASTAGPASAPEPGPASAEPGPAREPEPAGTADKK
jgi:hypothetical protein